MDYKFELYFEKTFFYCDLQRKAQTKTWNEIRNSNQKRR